MQVVIRYFKVQIILSYTMVKEAVGTSIDATGLIAGEVYYFKLQSKNSEGTSNQTKVVAAMPSLYESDILIVDGVERRTFDADCTI